MFAALGIGFAVAAGFFGIGVLLGLIYVLIRYGIPLVIGIAGLMLDVLLSWAKVFKEGWDEGLWNTREREERARLKASGKSPQSQPENQV